MLMLIDSLQQRVSTLEQVVETLTQEVRRQERPPSLIAGADSHVCMELNLHVFPEPACQYQDFSSKGPGQGMGRDGM